MGVSILPN
jgi:hypothetical protein